VTSQPNRASNPRCRDLTRALSVPSWEVENQAVSIAHVTTRGGAKVPENAMTEWVYKSRRARPTYADMHCLAVENHFLCVAAFIHCVGPERLRTAPRVADVAVDDIIHYYYRTPDGRVRSFGSFRVRDVGAYPGMFTALPDFGSLVQVNETLKNRKMLARLRRGYSNDPKLCAFTGWPLEKLPLDSGTPGFNQARMFPTLATTLWHYPDASLSRPISA
jgi:hypothetical protein